MKTLMTLLLTLSLCGGAMADTLQRAEKMTEQEKATLRLAEQKVAEAMKEVAKVQASIAKAHKMTKEEYLGSRFWYEIDGGYILQRHQSFSIDYNIMIQ